MEEQEKMEGKKKKKKELGITFKASTKCIENSSENKEEEYDFEVIKYLTKKFNKFLNKEKEAKKESKKKSKLIFHECNELGHIKLDCPYLKKHSKRRKKESY